MFKPLVAAMGLVGLMIAAAPALAGPAAATPATAPDQQMDKWWADLMGGEPAESRALLAFAGTPTQTVAFLKSRLKPLNMSEQDVRERIEELGSDQPAIWKPASEELEYFDPRLVIPLKKLMDDYSATPQRQRLVEVLCGYPPGTLGTEEVTLRQTAGGYYNFYNADKRTSFWAEARVDRIAKRTWTRAERAIVLLQYIGTPDAIAILKDMASGNPDAQPTKVAKDALDRGPIRAAAPTTP